MKRIVCPILTLLLILLFPACSSDSEYTPAEGMPDIYLNYVKIILDEETYNAVSESDFLREEFSNFQQESAVADNNETWTGTYLTGEHTYIELLKHNDQLGLEKGCCGIGFATENTNDIDKVYSTMKEKIKGAVKLEMRKRKLEEEMVPWFYRVSVNYPESKKGLETWIIEYHNDYLKTLLPEMEQDKWGISRKVYNSRYFKDSKYFKDIVEITLALDDELADRFCKEVCACGYEVEETADHKMCEGPGCRFRVVKARPYKQGIVEMKMSLLKDKDGEKVYNIGSASVLTFNDDRTASWKFM